ncbi:electron transfer flavoprotein beta subunit lysine methyltransferase [Xenopus laevis]|uniref:Electron transfer flavoprotein beta subunit lysine methyltransferase n=2 Tax=Xenopus laevis TaxID=8355 RepID=ETKMT_XENLA|nr:electron transfer flavoprotein beta subunit lysine methyltransferase [Xenopus laevis]Q4V7W8.1 RecName: Full=Electron transfer flavoprotein beta subunit lysine methyltransferase; AltName: Full=ETFB lysine methyltransferase; Short=ETFB-KMT; AltName: Full=Protein N-lysine methyltransferase METTL20; Flags: Precursor [Xenopus laevis]AAH97686.1 MGC115218 protein [Xenopus laevis]OCT86072.1 hypothetical protein XELAEV_18019766mg [Xenopus laevis]
MLRTARFLQRSISATSRPNCIVQPQRTSATCPRSFILQHTEATSDPLTPEIRLRLLTPRCDFWRQKPELWPYGDPYWAIYWPGGQALSRFLLDNPQIVRGGRVLDLGCGCGAAAIAAWMGGASYVLANDIDPVAGEAFRLNCELNNMKPLDFQAENLIGRETGPWSLIVLGDMFYDAELADLLCDWLRRSIRSHGTKVLIGDPGRAQFSSHPVLRHLQPLAQYSLSDSTKEENYGLTDSTVWSFEP